MTGLRESQQRLRQMPNAYDQGQASSRIVARLKSVSLDERLVVKRFYDLDIPFADVS